MASDGATATVSKAASCPTPAPPFIFTLVGNIPLEFHTPDLRNYFAYAIEKEWFVCFNYRQRPHPSRAFNLAICKVKASRFDELVVLYDKKNWLDSRGMLSKSKCSIVKIKVQVGSSSSSLKNKTTTTTPGGDLETEGLGQAELNDLLEFRKIPHWMPAGNVGTPTRVFIDYINQCVFPQSLIAKLGINLSSYKANSKSRIYSNVEYHYDYQQPRASRGTTRKDQEERRDPASTTNDQVEHVSVARTANGHAIDETLDDEERISEINFRRLYKAAAARAQRDKDDGEGTKEDNDAGDELEDWERHEALHDDVTKQDRTSPYFFEHEIELKWEKGGSGLVFYTDDNFWKEHEGKDFDAETADDWDVDMSVYYEENGGDRDAREIIDIRRQEMMRSGADTSLFDQKEASKMNVFSKSSCRAPPRSSRDFAPPPPPGPKRPDHYTKGIGRLLLERQGWQEGEPVGLPGRSGLREALDASAGKTNPGDKTGIGYSGVKVDRDQIIRAQRERRAREAQAQPYHIGSKFDQMDASKPETLLRRFDPSMKYRRPNDEGEDDEEICKFQKTC